MSESIRSDSPIPRGARVLAYLRVSGRDQAERGTPVHGQRRALQDYVGRHDLLLAHEPFVDEAKPGSSTAGREAFLDMIGFCEAQANRIDGLIFWSWSRFARDQDDTHFYKATLRRRGIAVWSLTDDVPTGEWEYIFEALIHWEDQRRLQEISHSARRGLHSVAELEARADHAGILREAQRWRRHHIIGDRKHGRPS